MNGPRFRFDIHHRCGKARCGEIAMRRGSIRTPAFMPVGTAATVKAMKPETVRETGADIILGNTYHLMLRPGAERVAKLFLGLSRKAMAQGLAVTLQWVNGHPALIGWEDGRLVSVAGLEVVTGDDGPRIGRIWVVRNPDKLGRALTALG